MRTDRETTRLVRSWLEDGATALPDRVLDAVLDQVPATPQRRSLWSARRFEAVNNALKVALAAAAVVVVAVVGINLLPGSGGTGGSSQTPAPSPSASPKVAIGPLDPGTYLIDAPKVTAVPFSFSVPAGWTGRSDGYVFRSDESPEVAFGTYLVTHVYTDACKSEGNLTPVGPTVDDLVRALEDQVGSDASTPVDVTLGGYPAKRIDISIPADLDTATCREPGMLIQIWADEAETSYLAIPTEPAGLVVEVYIVDVNGDRGVIVTGHPSAAPASELAELDGVIDSITFKP